MRVLAAVEQPYCPHSRINRITEKTTIASSSLLRLQVPINHRASYRFLLVLPQLLGVFGLPRNEATEGPVSEKATSRQLGFQEG